MPNRLIDETSPYLLQHAHNPVDWYPWGEEALARAKKEDKPILLSVGYSACHWCHVMEKESFEDKPTAEIMNRDFVPIKVDREERPDIDEIYMNAVQAFTGGHGGWPMTVFLTPDGRPFLGGTYFPPDASRGMPSFRQVMARAVDLYRNQKPALERVTGHVLEVVQGIGRLPEAEGNEQMEWLEPIAESAEESFDDRFGGFGHAPKFPPHGTLAVLLAQHATAGNARALEMVEVTLDAMSQGGMYDLLGGGFARYSVDESWTIPHFEKMLYDNAQLVPVYLDAYRLTKKKHYRQIAEETLAWAMREMIDPETGAFFAAQDADSEGVEGKFFVFDPEGLAQILGEEEGKRAAQLFSVTKEGNFEHGKSVLRLSKPRSQLSPEDHALYARVRPKLFEAREKRVHPGLDDKTIASWNGMMISAFAHAAAVLDPKPYAAVAARAAEFILDRMITGGRLMRTYKKGRARHLAYLDDHVLVGSALVDLYQATLDPKWLERALQLADETVRLFWDPDEGAFFFTGNDAEKLLARSKNLIGGATPSGNGAAALWLVRLAALAEKKDLGEKADRILRAYRVLLERAPRALGPEALAGAWNERAPKEIGVVGKRDDKKTQAFIDAVHARYLPFSVLGHVEPGEAPKLLPWMEGKTAVAGSTTGYLCENRSCRAPAVELDDWTKQLDQAAKPRVKEAQADQDVRVRAPELPQSPDLWINSDRPLDRAALEGWIAVLDFWTYCCINCMHVLPELAAVEARFSGRPVVVIGVHAAKFPAEKEAENVRRAALRHHVDHPVVLDSEHRLWEAFAVRSWPTIVVLDAKGRVAWRKSGEVDREELGRVVERLLDEGAREGTLATAKIAHKAAQKIESKLEFPGKVHVFAGDGADARAYIADSGHHRILEAKIAFERDGWPRLEIERTIGDGVPRLKDGAIGEASFRGPQGIYRYQNTLWVADTENHALRAVDLAGGTVRTIAGTGERGRGAARADPRKPRSLALRSPWDVAALEGGVFIAMAGTHQIWVYLPDRDQIGPMIGSGREDHVDGPFAEAALAQPSGFALFGHLLFFADSETSSIRLADLRENTVATVVGRGLFDFGDVDGEGDKVRLQHPLGVAFEGGKLYVADTFNDKIKLIDLEVGTTRTFAQALKEPGGIAVLGDFLLVADTGNHRIVAISRATGEVRCVS